MLGRRTRDLWRLCAAASAATYVACAGDPADVPPAEIDLAITSTRLDNGLSVVVVPNRALPIVSAVVTFHSGAFVEDATQSGYSHLLEHMIFQGNSRSPDSTQFVQQLDALGALWNGTTARDAVSYYYTLPTENLEVGLELLADSVRAPELDPTQLQKEIRVVLAEFDLDDTDHADVAHRHMLELLFDVYPNRADALGSRSVVQAATADALRALHDIYYVPNNAQLVLTGDVDVATAIQLAKQSFGDWPRAADPFVDHPVPVHPDLPADTSDTLIADVSASSLIVAFQGPSRNEDFRASVAADVLAQVSLLSDQDFRSLVAPPAITGAVLRHYPSSHKGVLTFELEIGSGFERAAIAKLGEAQKQLAHSITDEQVRAAKSALWQQRLQNADQNLNLALELQSDWAMAPTGSDRDYIATL